MEDFMNAISHPVVLMLLGALITTLLTLLTTRWTKELERRKYNKQIAETLILGRSKTPREESRIDTDGETERTDI